MDVETLRASLKVLKERRLLVHLREHNPRGARHTKRLGGTSGVSTGDVLAQLRKMGRLSTTVSDTPTIGGTENGGSTEQSSG